MRWRHRQTGGHPVGTTVEVVDLFFNTPARRKFMRSERPNLPTSTNWCAASRLSRFDATLILRHGGKVVRQYKAANTVAEQDALPPSAAPLHAPCPLAVSANTATCGCGAGWATPAGARPQNDLQYTYVNGRMMRDKLINHAIRQAYDELLPADRFAAYVLYIRLDPRQVDVNVHPAKLCGFIRRVSSTIFVFQALFTPCARTEGSATDEPLAGPRSGCRAAGSPCSWVGRRAPGGTVPNTAIRLLPCR